MQYCIKVRQAVYPYTVCDYVPPDEPSMFLTDDAWIATDLVVSLNESDSDHEYYRQTFFAEGDESWRDRERKRIQHFRKHGAQTRLYIMDLLRERCPELAASIPEWSCPWVDVTYSADGTPQVHFYDDLQDCRVDVVASSRLGRYLNKMCKDADLDEISESDQDSIAAQITIHGCRIQLLTGAYQIEDMYLQSEENGFGACMSHERSEYVFCDEDDHPVHAYGGSPNMAVAAMYRGDRLAARTVVRTDTKIYGKIYGDHYRMTAVLENDGYRKWHSNDPERSFAGGKLSHHVLRESDEGDTIMVLAPYLDVAEYVKEEDGWLVICGPGESAWPESVNDPVIYQARGTDGAARRTYRCTSCDSEAYWSYEASETPLVVDGDFYCYHCYRDRFFSCVDCDEEKYTTERATGEIQYYGTGRGQPNLIRSHSSANICTSCAEDYKMCQHCGLGVPCDALCDHVTGADGTKRLVCESCLRYGKEYVSLEHSEKGAWYHVEYAGVLWDTKNFRYYLSPDATGLEAAAEALVNISTDSA